MAFEESARRFCSIVFGKMPRAARSSPLGWKRPKTDRPGVLVPSLRALLTRLNRGAAAKAAALRALRALSGFAKALNFKYADLQMGLEVEPEPGLADSGDLETDLT